MSRPTTPKASVAILMSTYNGERYLKEQIESILIQTYREFVIYIRDDGSTDGTTEIIEKYKIEYPRLIFHIEDNHGNMGVARSFLALLDQVNSQTYTMFCDQDDVWLPEKIEKFVCKIQGVESQHKIDTPILVFGDMIVTDEKLSIISNSFWSYQKIQINNHKNWKKIAVSNCVTGCSSIFNRRALRLISEFGPSSVLHDLLSAVLVAKNGIIEPIYAPTMLYRQHAVNIEGAKRFGVLYIAIKLKRFFYSSVPRYIEFCRQISLPLWLAAWLKLFTTLSRLLPYKTK